MYLMSLTNKCIRTKLYAVLIGLLCINTVNAQDKIDFATAKARYPHDELLYLNDEEHVMIQIKDNKLDIQRKINNSILYLSERAPEYASKSIFYVDSLEEISGIEAKTMVPSGKSFKTLKVNNIITA